MPRALSACLLLPLLAAGDAAAPAVPKGQTGFAEGDYGTYLASTVQLAKDNLVTRGLAVRLDVEAAVCFDTECLRLAGAWTGGWLGGAGLPQMWTQHRGKHPHPLGAVQVATRPGPGWSDDGSFRDPRATRDKPLPRAQGRWLGHHRHGDQVVFAYQVFGTAVLELPGLARGDGITAFTRTLALAAHAGPLHLLVAELPGASGAGGAAGEVATLSLGAEAVAAVVHGAPAGAAWTTSGGRLVLMLPAAAAPARLRVSSARLPATQAAALARVAAGPVADPAALTAGGPSRWAAAVTTAAAVGDGAGPWTLDALTIPESNPWRSWMRIGGFDFFADGRRAALCTGNGDVWIVDGLGASPSTLAWRRFATGLHQPLGLRIVDGLVHTVGRDQLTRLHDRDGDGEADWYECLDNSHGLTASYHEFCFDLQTDAKGDFYFAKSGHEQASLSGENCCLIRVARDGSAYQVVATGLRTANGTGITPDGRIITGDNQGQWMPSSPVRIVEPGGFHGFLHGNGAGDTRAPLPPLVWIPYQQDRSGGGQAWLPDERWGPFRDRIAHVSYGNGALFVVLTDAADPGQAAAVKLPVSFPTGAMRCRVHPGDGQLYVAGMRGWSSAGTRDGGFHRVRRTGRPVRLPVAWRCLPGAIEITLAEPLDRASAESTGNWACEAFNVVRTAGYGSPEFAPSDPKKKAREPWAVTGASLAADGRSVRVAIAGLRPVTNCILKAKLTAADGQPVAFELLATLHRVPK